MGISFLKAAKPCLILWNGRLALKFIIPTLSGHSAPEQGPGGVRQARLPCKLLRDRVITVAIVLASRHCPGPTKRHCGQVEIRNSKQIRISNFEFLTEKTGFSVKHYLLTRIFQTQQVIPRIGLFYLCHDTLSRGKILAIFPPHFRHQQKVR